MSFPQSRIEKWLFYESFKLDRLMVAKYLRMGQAKFEKAMVKPEMHLTTVHIHKIAAILDRPAEEVFLACKQNYIKNQTDADQKSIGYVFFLDRFFQDTADE